MPKRIITWAVLEELGKLTQALEAYNKALSIKPNYSNAHYNIGNTLRDQGQLSEAIAAYNKAVTINPIILRHITWELPLKKKANWKGR